MAPVLFPAFLLAQGKLPGRVVCPLLAGPGFPCFGVGFPLGLEGALGFGAQGRRVQLLLDGPLEAFGVGPGPDGGFCRQRRAEGQVPPVALEKGIDLGVLGLCPEEDLADLVLPVLLPLIQADPKGILKGYREVESAGFILGSSLKKMPAGKGQPRRQVTDGCSRSRTTNRDVF